jgi:hypothetical protein
MDRSVFDQNITPHYHTPHTLPRAIMRKSKSVFDSISNRQCLMRVLNALTQNSNEGFHYLI